MKHFFSTPVFAILVCLLLGHVPAEQQQSVLGMLRFGSEEKIGKIQDLEGTDYKLSHKYTLYFFMAGIYVSDDGYVLQKKADRDAYYPLSEEKIKELQRTGMLPSPLPNYSIPIIDYLFGYSLWIIVAFAAGAPFLRHLVRRLMGKRFCPSCKLELTPHESETKICGVCNTPLKG